MSDPKTKTNPGKREEQLNRLANAAVHAGVKVQPGQLVIIRAETEMRDLVHAISRKAWNAGAGDVQVFWSDEELSRQFYTHAKDDVLETIPEWMSVRYEEAARKGACFLALDGDDPDGFKDVDPRKMTRRSLAMRKKTQLYRSGIDEGKIAWTVIPCATKAWAKKVYPECDEEEAVNRLWDDLMSICRIEDDGREAWETHTASLERKAARLNERGYKKFHYTSSNGTDLWVDLVDGSIFVGGDTKLASGLSISCNIPTEEIFSTPLKTGVNGTLEAVMPLNWNGMRIDGFGFTFQDGKVIDFHAREGYESLKALLESDPNGKYLGEIAIVDKTSPIRQKNRIYYNTLLDENAACHFAFGQSYMETLPALEGASCEELEAHGMNQSDIHVDFMVGAEDLHITGVRADGTEEDVFVNGRFSPSFDRIA